MKKYIQLIRVKHWIKNGIVFLPLFFGKQLFQTDLFLHTLAGVLSFCCMSSMIYIINDIQDRDKDRLHGTKRNRPIASGSISAVQGICIAVIMFICSVVFNVIASTHIVKSFIVLFLYLAINLSYSCLGAKNVAILDIVLLVSGFFLRLLYGATVSGISISSWLYLTVISGSFFLSLCKRRNECKNMGGVQEQY